MNNKYKLLICWFYNGIMHKNKRLLMKILKNIFKRIWLLVKVAFSSKDRFELIESIVSRPKNDHKGYGINDFIYIELNSNKLNNVYTNSGTKKEQERIIQRMIESNCLELDYLKDRKLIELKAIEIIQKFADIYWLELEADVKHTKHQIISGLAGGILYTIMTYTKKEKLIYLEKNFNFIDTIMIILFRAIEELKLPDDTEENLSRISSIIEHGYYLIDGKDEDNRIWLFPEQVGIYSVEKPITQNVNMKTK